MNDQDDSLPEETPEENVENTEEVQSQEPDETDAEATSEESTQDESPEESSEPASEPAPEVVVVESDYQADFSEPRLNQIVMSVVEPLSGDSPIGTDNGQVDSALTKISSLDEIQTKIKNDFASANRNDSFDNFDVSVSGIGSDDLADVAINCLANECKSLLLCANLPRLLMVEFGFEGFAAGIEAFSEMMFRYGPSLAARENALGNVLRKGIYVGNDEKTDLNYMMFLVSPVTHSGRLPYAFLRNALLHGQKEENISKYNSDAQESTPEQYTKTVGDLKRIVEAARLCNERLQELFDGDHMVQLIEFKFIESVERMASIVHNLASDHCSGYPIEEVAEEAAEGGEGATVAAAAPQPAQIGAVTNRKQAIELLKKIADFFYETEKHSPVSYSLRQAIRWSKMDLPELMNELLNGEDEPMQELQKRVGFSNMPEDSDED